MRVAARVRSRVRRLTRTRCAGEAAVGKSSIVLRFATNEFQDNREPTIGGARVLSGADLPTAKPSDYVPVQPRSLPARSMWTAAPSSLRFGTLLAKKIRLPFRAFFAD